MKHGPLVHGSPVIKGFLCGSLLAGSLAAPFGIIAQLALFVIACLIFLDSIFLFNKELHLLSFLLAAIVGFFISLLSTLLALLSPYLLIIFIVMAIVYLYEYMSYRESRKK